VDDHAPGLKIRKIFLESFGYSVAIANSGAAALNSIEKRSFDVVVLDYRMPEMNGLELARKIRERFPGLRLVVLSGYSAELPIELHDLVDGYVTKGSHPEELLRRLEQVLGSAPRKRRIGQGPSTQELLSTSHEHLQESKRQIQRAHEQVSRGGKTKRPGGRRTA